MFERLLPLSLVLLPFAAQEDLDAQGEQERLARLHKELQIERDKAQEVERTIANARQDLRRTTKEVERFERELIMGPDPARLGQLRAQRDEVDVELAVHEAQRTAMEEQMLQLSRELQEKLDQDKLLKSLRAAVATLEKLPQYYNFDDMSEEILDLRWRAVEAQIEVENRRSTLTDRNGGRLLETLKERAIEVEIERRGLEVRRQMLTKLSENLAEELEKLRNGRAKLERRMDHVQERVLELEKEHHRHYDRIAILKQRIGLSSEGR